MFFVQLRGYYSTATHYKDILLNVSCSVLHIVYKDGKLFLNINVLHLNSLLLNKAKIVNIQSF